MNGKGSCGQQTRVLERAGYGQRVLVMELFQDRMFTTAGSQTPTYYVVTDVDFQELGPYIEDIQVVAEIKGATTSFRFKVIGQKSYAGQSWTNFGGGELLGVQTPSATSPIVGSPYATRTDLGAPLIQVLIGVYNDTGISTNESGFVSLTLVIKFWSR